MKATCKTAKAKLAKAGKNAIGECGVDRGIALKVRVGRDIAVDEALRRYGAMKALPGRLVGGEEVASEIGGWCGRGLAKLKCAVPLKHLGSGEFSE